MPDRCDGSPFCSIQGTTSAMYSMYFSEERHRSGQNGTRPSGLSSQMAPCCVARLSFGLVLRQADIDGFRATQMIQDKAQFAGNGMSFSRTATPYWSIWVAPFGRAVKRSFALLHLWVRTCHYRRGAPSSQPLHDSLNPSISACRSTTKPHSSRLAWYHLGRQRSDLASVNRP